MKGTSNRPIVLKFESSTGLPSEQLFTETLMTYLDAHEVKPLFFGQRRKSFIRGLIVLRSAKGLDQFMTAPVFYIRRCRITVSYASDSDIQDISQRMNVKMFVKVFHRTIEIDDLKNYFSNYGSVDYVQVISSKAKYPNTRIAFVTFHNNQALQASLQCPQHFIGEIELHCQPFNDDLLLNTEKTPQERKYIDPSSVPLMSKAAQEDEGKGKKMKNDLERVFFYPSLSSLLQTEPGLSKYMYKVNLRVDSNYRLSIRFRNSKVYLACTDSNPISTSSDNHQQEPEVERRREQIEEFNDQTNANSNENAQIVPSEVVPYKTNPMDNRNIHFRTFTPWKAQQRFASKEGGEKFAHRHRRPNNQSS